MSGFMHFVAANDVAIGIAGTLIVILAVVSGFGRHHRRGTDNATRDGERR